MSHTLPIVVTGGLIRNLLKQSFKLRIPGDVGKDKKQDLAARTITLPPNTDVEIDYRDFRAVLPELIDLERRQVVKIIRYPEVESGVIELEENYVKKLDKTSAINFVRNFKVESREDEEGHGRVRVSLAWETITDPSLLPPNPDPYQTLIFEGGGLYFHDPDSDLWVSVSVLSKSWARPGTASAQQVELGMPQVFLSPVLITKVEGSEGVKYDFIDPSTRQVKLSSEGFAPTFFPAGTRLVAVRHSPLGTPVTNPQVVLHYREVI